MKKGIFFAYPPIQYIAFTKSWILINLCTRHVAVVGIVNTINIFEHLKNIQYCIDYFNYFWIFAMIITILQLLGKKRKLRLGQKTSSISASFVAERLNVLRLWKRVKRLTGSSSMAGADLFSTLPIMSCHMCVLVESSQDLRIVILRIVMIDGRWWFPAASFHSGACKEGWWTTKMLLKQICHLLLLRWETDMFLKLLDSTWHFSWPRWLIMIITVMLMRLYSQYDPDLHIMAFQA